MASRMHRYTLSIAACRTSEELRDLLRVIVGAGLPEKEFSHLYGLVTARHHALSKEEEEARK
jgi:hypothetical protein